MLHTGHAAGFGEHLGQGAGEPVVELALHREQWTAARQVGPCSGVPFAHLVSTRIVDGADLSRAAVRRHVTVDMHDAHWPFVLAHPFTGDLPHQFGGASLLLQTMQLTAQCLDLRRAVQTQYPSELLHVVPTQMLGPFDPQQRHEHERHQHGAHAVEGCGKGTVEALSQTQERVLGQHRHREEGPSPIEPFARGKQGLGIGQLAQACQQAVFTAVHRHGCLDAVRHRRV